MPLPLKTGPHTWIDEAARVLTPPTRPPYPFAAVSDTTAVAAIADIEVTMPDGAPATLRSIAALGLAPAPM
ncbi:hypothetical protein [Tsukamurella soli]|uniref:Uncharacterized protein n=1 Tax=Tsukamurella soli TaxID=644556 RepID=A0ABP8K6T2_9ACTN